MGTRTEASARAEPDMPAKVIVDKWSIDQAIDWGDKKIKEIYDTIGG